MKSKLPHRLFSLFLCLAMILSLCVPACAAPRQKSAARKETAEKAPEKPLPVKLNYGYYLIGRYGWTADDLDESRDRFQINYAASTEEYKLLTILEEGQQLKVVLVSNGTELGPWYPDPGDNYTVDAAHAGLKMIYFRPVYNSDWAEFGGYMYIADPPLYQVSVSQPLHGVLVPDKTAAAEGETVTVEAVPDPGYYPAMQMKASPYPSDTQWPDDFHFIFTMPASDVTVSIGWNQMCVDAGYYYGGDRNVMDLTPEDKFAEYDSVYGDYVQEAVLAEGHVFQMARVITQQGWTWDGSLWNPDITEEMAGHVRIFLSRTEREGYVKVFEQLPYVPGSEDVWALIRYFHPITVEPVAHGTVTAPADAFPGDTVTLNVTHEEGYTLDTLTVEDETGTPVEVSGNSFVMPDARVIVRAVFRQVPLYSIVLAGAGEGVNVTSSRETAQEGDPVDVSITTDADHRFVSITVTDAEGNGIGTEKLPGSGNKYRFIMPASDVTVTVVSKTVYPLYLVNTQADSFNCSDILGDGTASYDPASRTLHFASSEPDFGNAYGSALIYWTGEDGLTVEAPQGLHLTGNATYCAYAASGDITFNGDLLLDIPTESNGIWGMKNVTVNGNVNGTVKAIALYGYNGLTVNGSVNVANQDSIRTVFSMGRAVITGDFTAAGYGIDAAGGISIGGNVIITSTGASNRGLQSGNGGISVGGSFDFSSKALYVAWA